MSNLPMNIVVMVTSMRHAVLLVALALLGCNQDRIAKLEEQVKSLEQRNAELVSERVRGEEALKQSQLCAKAAKDFLDRPEWKDGDPLGGARSEISHYNKKLNKCLIKLHTTHIVKGDVMEMDHIYDALEGRALGGKIVIKDLRTREDKSITLVKDGQFIRDPVEGRALLAWFEQSMEQ